MAGYTRVDVENKISNGSVADANDINAEFNALQSAFGAITGHDHGGEAGNGAPITKIGPAQSFVAGITSLLPKTTQTHNLGSTTLQFRHVVSQRLLGSSGGSVTTPSWSFIDREDTGANYYVSTGTLSFVHHGKNLLDITATAITARTGVAFTGSGSGLTGLNASQLTTGTIPIERLPAGQTGTFTGTFIGNGTQITNISATNIDRGTLNAARLPSAISGTFTGVGTGLTALNAANLDRGTIPAARLPSTINATFIGNGSQLSSLNASAITTGTIADARLPANITASSFSGGGTNLTSLNASNIDRGTLNIDRLAVSSLENVWLRRVNTFSQPGDLGSIAYLKNITGGILTTGQTISGNLLRYGEGSGVPEGDWRCMGYLNNNSIGLFLRYQ